MPSEKKTIAAKPAAKKSIAAAQPPTKSAAVAKLTSKKSIASTQPPVKNAVIVPPPTTLTVIGPSRDNEPPLWEAQLEVVKMNAPTANEQALRSLFLNRTATRNVGAKPLLPPDTVLAWGKVISATLTLGGQSYRWRSSASAVNPVTLLLQAVPEDWIVKSGKLQYPTFTCIAGEISLDLLESSAEAGPTDWQRHFENLLDAADLKLHASGLSLVGTGKLDWDDELIRAPFHVFAPFPNHAGELQMVLDRERMSEETEQQFARAFARLAAALQSEQSADRPRWASLELTGETSVPDFRWAIRPASSGKDNYALQLGRGTLHLLLADRAAGAKDSPRSLCRALPAVVSIRREERTEQEGAQQVTVQKLAVTFDSDSDTPTSPPRPGDSYFHYEARRDAQTGALNEQARIANATTAYDVISAAVGLREQYALAAPDPDSTVKNTALLWGFAPLEDGWAQLPFLNLTEQVYLNVFQPTPEEQTPSDELPLLSGAFSVGNDAQNLSSTKPAEQPWSATLLDAEKYGGEWKLSRKFAASAQPNAAEWQHDEATAWFFQPEVVLNGFLWLATGQPSAADALPDLDDWLAGLRMVSLRTLLPDDNYPAPFVLRFEELNFALDPGQQTPALRDWRLLFQANTQAYHRRPDSSVFETLALKGPWAAEAKQNIWRDLPLVWRRHPSLPAIQALPLTQNQTPPNYPSHSRQLAPFELPVEKSAGAKVALPAKWQFGIEVGTTTGGAAGAERWPQLLNPEVSAAAMEWKEAGLLWMASLSIPGLVFDPNSKDAPLASTVSFLPARYQFSLPYTTEPNALAQLPKEQPKDQPPDLRPSQTAPVLAMQRGDYKQHWRGLGERAFLAWPDADSALVGGNAGTVITCLIEPYSWPVQAVLAESSYPGSLTLNDSTGAPLKLEKEAALRGIEGAFDVVDGKLRRTGNATVAAQFTVVAGSMNAHGSGGRLRDQRGLWRKATSPAADGKLLKTSVQREGQSELLLCSLPAPLRLAIKGNAPDDNQYWRLWFRDVPVAGKTFDRSTTRSALARGVNDPAAASPEFVHLTGYEWRLAAESLAVETKSQSIFLPLLSLHFYPLALEKVEIDGDVVTTVEMTGRLQLPANPPIEQADLNNAVRVSFARQGDHLELQSIAIAAVEADPGTAQPEMSPIEWPLGDNEFVPSLICDEIRYVKNAAQIIAKTQLQFSLFDVRWSLPKRDLEFPLGELNFTADDFGAPADPAIRIGAVNLKLDPAQNKLAISLSFQWAGDTIAGARTLATISMTGEGAGATTIKAMLRQKDQELEFKQPEAALSRSSRAIQFSFSQTDHAAQSQYQLLPGMHLSSRESVQGFGVMAFSAVERNGATPELILLSASLEALLPCAWGQQLQEAVSGAPQDLACIFGSSAGRLYGGYTLVAQRSGNGKYEWAASLLLNGFLEVKNLISWPLLPADALEALKAKPLPIYTLPAARPDAPGDLPALNHLRHTMRVLFNQHEVPAGLLTAGAGRLLFDFAANRSWQFLAIVEHQLIEVRANSPREARLAVASVSRDRRWTTVQEVRLLKPETFSAFLRQMIDAKYVTFDPAQGTTPTGLIRTARGYHREEFINLLTKGPQRGDEFARMRETLIVEAGAVHWIKQSANATAQFTSLQYLPQGTQRAILSLPEDFASPDENDTPWLLLALPFLGRLQAQEKDRLVPETALSEDDSLLQVDPLMLIDRQRRAIATKTAMSDVPLVFASWGDHEEKTFNLSEFDISPARLFNRLDPATLIEQWFRLQSPTSETIGAALASVTAALPEDSPGRLGRPAALARQFDAYRSGIPPRDPKQAAPKPEQTNPESEIVWQRDSLFFIQGASNQNELFYSFVFTGAQIFTANLEAAPDGTTRHSAATLVPASLRITPTVSNRQPVSLAVSPYLGLEFQRLNADKLRLTVAELLCLDPNKLRLNVVASQIWQEADGSESNIRSWGLEAHSRLAGDSPAAVLRVRRVMADSDAQDSAVGVTVEYQFFVLDVQPPASLKRRTRRVRARLEALRFAEGQFGGDRLPSPEGDNCLLNFELAPPQTRGTQSLYLADRPSSSEADNVGAAGVGEATKWPWGLSALRFGLQYTSDGVGVAGPLIKQTSSDRIRLWWQALAHSVQFALTDPSGKRKLLPQRFRARSISSLLSASPNLPLPSRDELKLSPPGTPNTDADQPLTAWQPLLPGALQYLILGGRTGAPFVFRNHLLRHDVSRSPSGGLTSGDTVFASGCVPVQHRMPRPPALPPNHKGAEATALHTWASYFDPERSVNATDNPADHALLAAGEPIDLQMQLIEPQGGMLRQDGSGELLFEIKSLAGKQPATALANWAITVELVAGGRRLAYRPVSAQPEPGDRYRFVPTGNGDGGEQLRRAIGDLPHGSEAFIQVAAEALPPPGNQTQMIQGYQQSLNFPVRVSRNGQTYLPLRASFLQFEDPEYNRRLSSTTASATNLVTAGSARYEITLATDRREYNATTTLFAVFFGDAASGANQAQLEITWIDAAGVKRPLAQTTMQRQKLERFDPGQLAAQYGGTLTPGDALFLRLTAVEKGLDVEVRVDIVAQPVIPASEAGYALLRQEGNTVECARFAWGPQASRIELTNPDDLTKDTVRRRAIFQWTDSARPGRNGRYFIQKLAGTGATSLGID